METESQDDHGDGLDIQVFDDEPEGDQAAAIVPSGGSENQVCCVGAGETPGTQVDASKFLSIKHGVCRRTTMLQTVLLCKRFFSTSSCDDVFQTTCNNKVDDNCDDMATTGYNDEDMSPRRALGDDITSWWIDDPTPHASLQQQQPCCRDSVAIMPSSSKSTN